MKLHCDLKTNALPMQVHRSSLEAPTITDVGEQSMSYERKLSPFLTQLGAVLRDRLLEEKWLLATSLRVGKQWLDALTLNGISVVNCRLFTVPGVAMRFAEAHLIEHGLAYCNEKRQLFIVDNILASLSSDESKYFTNLFPGPSLSKRVSGMLNALELAGIEVEDLDPHFFDGRAKYEDIVWVFRRYRDILAENKLADYSDVLKIAANSVACKQTGASNNAQVVIVPKELELCALERQFLASFPMDTVIYVEAFDGLSDMTNQRRTEQERISSVFKTLMMTAPERVIDFFSAVGPTNEIREILRRCAADNIRFDEVEIVQTDSQCYIPTIYETVVAALPDPMPAWSRVPVTFADGISAGVSRPGRALQAWIDWMRNDFPQAALVHIIENGLLDFGDRYTEDSHFRRLGGVLRELVIVNGQDRYLKRLRNKLGESRCVIDNCSQDCSEAVHKDNTDSEASVDLKTLYNFLERLLRISRSEGLSSIELIDNIGRFVQEFARSIDEIDNYARLAILNELDATGEWLKSQSLILTFDILEWARNMPSSLQILGSGPRPGCLHVSHIMNGGHSGRKYLFIVGLDQERFPGSPSIDPLLLDQERQEISEHLITSWKSHEQKLVAFLRLLSRQTGDICLSYSTTDLSDDTSYLPSSVFQAALHFCSSSTSGDNFERCPPAKEPLFQKFFPHLWRGLIALDARASDIFTEYDGNLGRAGGVFDPTEPGGPTLSVQRLETFAKCPLSFFFKYILSVTSPSESGMNWDEWLDPLEIGSLLHEVFRVFVQELMKHRRLPLAARDRGRLHSILNQYVEQCKEGHPPPNMHALYRQVRLLEAAADIFLVEEEIASRSLIPRFAEVSIGVRKSGEGTDLDQDAPENLEIEPGVFVRISGRVDRIDELVHGAQNEFVVWDYKTGGTYRYQRTDLFHQGRNLQHVIYMAVIASLLKRRLHRDVRVSKFGYYFPSLKGRGVRIVTDAERAGKGVEILQGLCRMMKHGCFPATTSAKEDCKYCEYSAICGDVDTVTAQSVKKIKNEFNEMLSDFRLIRGI